MIRDGWGEMAPIVTERRISINGDAKAEKDLSHESFTLDNNAEWNFCKTARKPYDYTVRKILKVAEEHGIVTDVSDDGPNEKFYTDQDYIDWRNGLKKLYFE